LAGWFVESLPPLIEAVDLPVRQEARLIGA